MPLPRNKLVMPFDFEIFAYRLLVLASTDMSVCQLLRVPVLELLFQLHRLHATALINI